MTSIQLPPDVIGHMAACGDTTRPLDLCDSCLRALIYGTLAHIGQAGADLMEADPLSAARHISAATVTLLELVKVDFAGAADVDDLPDDEWKLAMSAFIEKRTDHYVDYETGAVKFESHGDYDDDGDPAEMS